MKALDLGEVFRLSPNAYMVVDSSFNYVAANEAYLRATSSRLEDLLGRNVFDLFPNDPADPNNASATMLRRSFERVLQTGKQDVLAVIPYRVPRTLPDGTLEMADRYWSATHTPLLDEHGKVAFIFQHTVDITELQTLRVAAERAEEVSRPQDRFNAIGAGVLQRAERVQDANQLLQKERTRLMELFDQAPGFMTALEGPRHTFIMANQAYRRLTGGRELVGIDIRTALPELATQGFFELLDKVYSTGEPFIGRSVLVQLVLASGGTLEDRYVDFIYQPIRDASGAVTGIFVQGHDVTDKKQAELALRRLNEELEARVEARTGELLELNRELESFSYSVSHDLRAPLRHIAGFAQLLQKRAAATMDATSREYLKTIADSASEGGKLVDDLLSFSRMGRAELKRVDVSLGEVIAEVRKELEPEFSGRTIRWELQELPYVHVDPTLIRAAMKNLLANAIKYTRPREEAVIEIGGEQAQGEIHVWIRDNGVGFDMRYADKLFGVFQRLHSEESFEGTGIGLANVRRIVMRHGGRVWAEGKVDEGATFHFALPTSRNGTQALGRTG